MIISFGWTTPAILARRKTVTRREWDPRYADRFYEGQVCDAWNTSPRNVRGNPRKIATIRLTAKPTYELTRQAPPEDWEREGFEYLSANGHKVGKLTPEELWNQWHRHDNYARLWVVRFEIVEVVA